MFKKLIQRLRTQSIDKMPHEFKAIVDLINKTVSAEPHRVDCNCCNHTRFKVVYILEHPTQMRPVTKILNRLILALKGYDKPVPPVVYTVKGDRGITITFTKSKRNHVDSENILKTFAEASRI